MIARRFRTTLALIAAALLPMPALAQDWSGQVTLYGWGAGVTGDFRPFETAPTLTFDKSFSDLLEDLDGAFFLSGLARRDDLVLLGDFTYTTSSRDGLVPPGIPASGQVTIWSLTLAAGKRFDPAEGITIDLLGGARGWSVDGEVSVPLAGVSLAPEASFIDPIVALRVNAALAPRWSLIGYADIGGFGVGSELTWQGVATANYQATDNLYFSAGWRHLYLDYEDDGTLFEGAMSGPLFGATWRF